MGLDGDTHAMGRVRPRSKQDENLGKTGALPRLRATSSGASHGWRPAVFVGPKAKGVRLSGDGDAFKKVGNSRLAHKPSSDGTARSAHKTQTARARARKDGESTARRAERPGARGCEDTPQDGTQTTSSRRIKLLVVLAALVVVVVALYDPIRGWYCAERRQQDLAARYEQLDATNKTLKGEVDALQTPEGIKDEARSRGYVERGETPVTITGGPSTEQEKPSSDAAAISNQDTARAQTNDVTRVLDVIFQYHFEE